MNNVYPIVTWEIKPIEKQKDTNHYKLLEKLNNSEKLTREEKNSLNLIEYKGQYKCGGWAFNFRPYMKKFWVKLRGCEIEEYYAFDKTHMRSQLHYKYVSDYEILKIVEVPD